MTYWTIQITGIVATSFIALRFPRQVSRDLDDFGAWVVKQVTKWL